MVEYVFRGSRKMKEFWFLFVGFRVVGLDGLRVL